MNLYRGGEKTCTRSGSCWARFFSQRRFLSVRQKNCKKSKSGYESQRLHKKTLWNAEKKANSSVFIVSKTSLFQRRFCERKTNITHVFRVFEVATSSFCLCEVEIVHVIVVKITLLINLKETLTLFNLHLIDKPYQIQLSHC